MLLASVTCFAACTEHSAFDVERDVSRAQDVGQLLSNLKLAFERGLLLAPEFYGDSNLLKFFNATSIQWRLLVPPDMYLAVITPSPLLVGLKEISVRPWKRGATVLD